MAIIQFVNVVEMRKTNRSKAKNLICVKLKYTYKKGAFMQKEIRNSKPRIDLTGQHFGRWTAMYYVKPGKWHCKCECGKEKDVEGRNLRSGKTLSCGCLQKEQTSKANSIDYTNQDFGMLHTINKKRIDNRTYYECVCSCGNPNKILVSSSNLISGHTVSCGCIRSKGEKEILNFLIKNNISFIQEKTFDSCRIPDSGAKARFDFYLPDYDLLIEYDGEQHFIVSNWNTKEELERTQFRDNYKNSWCKDNNKKLLRIKYSDYDNLEKILRKEIFE